MRRLLYIIAVLIWCSAALGAEEILDYHSDIRVAADGSMTVEETIQVRAEGDRIRRGIYRDFPTRYQDRYGNDVVVAFQLDEVLRDGAPEPHHTEDRSNGVRIYAGSASRRLSPGTYTYVIRYRSDRQLGHFEDRDELYWNVNGNGWGFPIRRVSATVRLPDGVPMDQVRAELYTGAYGEGGSDGGLDILADRVEFSTDRSLAPGEGLTIAVDWPVGFVERPSSSQQVGYFLTDNRGPLIALLSLFLNLAYLLWAWDRVGRDPERGPVFPHYEPPAGLSPAAARYILEMGADDRCFTAALVNMATKGRLEIHEDDGEFTLIRRSPEGAPTLSKGEARMSKRLFRKGYELVLDQDNHEDVAAGRDGLEVVLESEYRDANFRNNRAWIVPGILLLIAGGALALLAQPTPVTLGLVGLQTLSLLWFAYLLRAPTLAGRRLMDRIEGFKEYLGVAEASRFADAPPDTPERFHTLLPYAIAFHLEEAWGDRFESVLAAAGEEAARPGWYYGNSWRIGRVSSFAGTVGHTMTGAISSAAMPPGSSSGVGGGGFSGGGGGGGGGGGW